MPSEEEILRQLSPQLTPTTLNAVAKKAAQARDIELEIADLEQRLKERKAQLRDIYHVELPELMDQAQTDRIGLPANGNLPACDLKLSPFYKANIAASWPPEKRQAAFEALTELGHQDLIKTEVSISLPRDQRDRLAELLALLGSYHPQIKESVHPSTLTAWLKEQFEHGNPIPPFELIGAEVGRVVKLTERKNG